MKVSYKKKIQNLLADLISGKKIQKNEILEIKHNDLFWEKLVKIASSNLILPKIYSEIKKNKLTNYIPSELNNYLHLIHDANNQRNKHIYTQIINLGDILSENLIDFVFLKGSAILLNSNDHTFGDRMIGDIDLLVKPTDIDFVLEIMFTNGYKYLKNINFSLTKDIDSVKTNHLPRLVHDDYIAAIEIHREPLEMKFSYKLPAELILRSKRKVAQNCFIPNQKFMWKHAILNWQINDRGFRRNTISFKPIIDVVNTEPKNINQLISNEISEIRHFYSLMSVFFPQYNSTNNFKKYLFKIQLKFNPFDRLINFFIRINDFIEILINRLQLFFRNSKYRKRIITNPKMLIQKIKNLKKTIFIF